LELVFFTSAQVCFMCYGRTSFMSIREKIAFCLNFIYEVVKCSAT